MYRYHRTIPSCLHIAGILFVQLWLAQGSYAGDQQPPNIVFIMADDLGFSELGVYGQQRIRTPHLDRLARGFVSQDTILVALYAPRLAAYL